MDPDLVSVFQAGKSVGVYSFLPKFNIIIGAIKSALYSDSKEWQQIV